MTMSPGGRFGPYEILSAIGAGGMGEVYRARDSKLNRDVAIKTVLPALANDPDRLARFSREAQLLASLNHPNIAHVYGLEEASGVGAIVMELVEGPTLAERIARGPIPVGEALAIASQIAAALEAAHEQGVIHRDLKPANVKVREDGTVKVLDFGLAKALDPVSSAVVNAMNSPTLTNATMHGVILGTAAYMSPEQARGKAVDKRADIWAFGVVLFEMLTGACPFESADVSDTLAFVLTKEPDWRMLPADTPPGITRLLRHCLAKDHRQRLGDIHDARIEINEAQAAPAADGAVVGPPRAGRRERLAWMVSAASVLVSGSLVALLAMGIIHLRETAPVAPAVRFSIAPGDALALTGRPVISPDGRRIVFAGVATNALWVRSLDAMSIQRLPGTEGARQPFWSPDSRSIGFFADGKLKKVDVDGGPAVTLCEATGAARGASWSPAGVILFASTASAIIQQVPAAGGIPIPATTIDQAQLGRDSWPYVLPDGRHFLYFGSHKFIGLFASSLDSKAGTPLVRTETSGAYASGFVLFMSGSSLMRQPFDLGRLQLGGDPAPTVENVGLSPAGDAAFSVSANGMLIYAGPEPTEKLRLVWVNRQAKVTPLALAPGAYGDPSLSPDGRQIAVAMTDATGSHIWIYDLARGTLGKRTFEGSNAFPLWSRDGQYVTFSRGPGMIGPLMRVRADGSGQAEPLVTDEQRPGLKVASSWSADGKLLAFQSGQDVIVRDATGALHPTLATPANELEGRFAPSGQWIAYRSNETGRDEVYVQSYPTGGGKWQISTDGGAQPMWSPTGRELFYKNGNRMMVVPVDAGTTFTPGTPRMLFEMPLPERVPGDPSRYVVTPDAERFLVLTTVTADSSSRPARPINVIVNWTAALQSPAAPK